MYTNHLFSVNQNEIAMIFKYSQGCIKLMYEIRITPFLSIRSVYKISDFVNTVIII